MLDIPLFPIDTRVGRETVSLPDVFARLCDGSLLGFDGLAAHQRPGWSLFLYQTAALALVRSGDADAVGDDAAWRDLADPAAWRERLAALTPGCAETAWSLVVDDVTRPAFLQPPIRRRSIDDYKPVAETPDELDVLVTAKGHDVKPARAGAPAPHDWVYALTNLQTMQGYSGRGNFGIARMNGGFASRPMFMLAPSADPGTCFRRGVEAALAARAAALDLEGGYYRDDGHALLWLEPWDDDSALALADLDPLFVEVCRRIRLVRRAEGCIEARGRPSQSARVQVPKEAKGNLGDAWTPLTAKEGAALTVGSGGLDYRLLHRVLDRKRNEFIWPAAMAQPLPGSADRAWLYAAVLVRGQGRTEGFHERWVPAKTKTVRRLMAAERVTAGSLGERMIADADAAKSALRAGVLAFLQGGRDQLDFKQPGAEDALTALDQRIDRIFFEHWFARIDASDDADARLATEEAWHRALVTQARKVFEHAREQLSPPASRIERAHAVAEMIFWARLRKTGLAGRPAPAIAESAA